MGGGKRPTTNTHICKICGKELKSLGIARHRAMHRDKARDKQQELNLGGDFYESPL